MREDPYKIFCKCGSYHSNDSLDCMNPAMVIECIGDAQDKMPYSNLHFNHFDAAIKLVELYCRENSIPMILGKE